MKITEKTKEYECCVSCKHNIRKKGDGKDGNYTYRECEIDKHYISHTANFDNVCERWVKWDDD
jgi:hypothetical protein